MSSSGQVQPPPQPQNPQPWDLAAAADAIRKKDDRFAQIAIEVQGGVVTLRGPATQWDYLHLLASQVRRIPGVQAVVLDTVPGN